MKSIESQGKTLELAIENGLAELNVPKERVDVEVISQGGLFKKPTVRLTLKKTEGEKALEFIEGLIETLSITAFAELQETDDTASINIVGADISTLIGHRGEVLDAVQYLSSLIANKDKANFKRIVVDGEGYRTKRANTLEELADRLAKKAVERQGSVATEAMNPYERRIIHAYLQANGEVTTHSEGEEPHRYLVITPKGVTPGGHRVPGPRGQNGGGRRDGNRNGQGGGRRDGNRGGQGGSNRNGNRGGGNRDRSRQGNYNNAPAQSSAPAHEKNAETGAAQKPRSGNRQYAFKSINRRPSPYSGFGPSTAKQSGFSDDGFGKQSGFSDAALMEKGASKFSKE